MLNKIARKYLEKKADGSVHKPLDDRAMHDIYSRAEGLPELFGHSDARKQVAGGIGDALLGYVNSMVKPAGEMGWKLVNRVLAKHYATKPSKRIKAEQAAINSADPVVTQYIPNRYKAALNYNSYPANYVDLRNELDMNTILDYDGVNNMLNKDAESWYNATLPANKMDPWIREGAKFATTAGLSATLFNTNVAPVLASRLGIAGKIAGTAFDWLGPDYAWEIGTDYAAKPSDNFRNWAVQKYKVK